MKAQPPMFSERPPQSSSPARWHISSSLPRQKQTRKAISFISGGRLSVRTHIRYSAVTRFISVRANASVHSTATQRTRQSRISTMITASVRTAQTAISLQLILTGTACMRSQTAVSSTGSWSMSMRAMPQQIPFLQRISP